jgi:hypothetical protein
MPILIFEGLEKLYKKLKQRKKIIGKKKINLTQLISMLASFQYSKQDIKNSIKLKGNILIIS